MTLADALNIMLAGKRRSGRQISAFYYLLPPKENCCWGQCTHLHMDVNCARIMIEIEFFFLAFNGGSDIIVNTWTP
jgi:hypothetical protein